MTLADAPLAAAGLVGLALLALAAVAVALRPSGRRPRRLSAVVARQGEVGAPGRAGAASAQRRRIDETLKALAERQRQEAKRSTRVSLDARLKQAGLPWSRRAYVLVCVGAASLVFLAVYGPLGVGLLPALAFGAAGGAALPHFYVSRRRDRRLFAVAAELPEALDTIVRGVRAGLPVGDCLRSIATDGREPLKGEFRLLVEDLAVGLPIDDALTRMARRCPALEIKLLGVILAIQSRAGGNLSEALGNLSGVLRDRKKMRGKIRAMSSEATASAAIIGSLPVVVAILLYMTAPDYVSLLFTTMLGQMALVACGLWMTLGVLVMRKMIRFDF